jgi:hypothetical protein
MIQTFSPAGFMLLLAQTAVTGLKSRRPSAGGAYLRFYSRLEPFFTKEWRALVK